MLKTDVKFFGYNTIFLFLLVLSGCLIYSNSLHVPFVYDDIINIVENESIRPQGNTFEQIYSIIVNLGNRPFSYLSFALNHHINGIDPFGYHIFNVGIHIITGILLFFFIKITLTQIRLNSHYKTQTLSNDYLFKHNIESIAFFSAMIWLVHPLHTQSVTYVVQRMNAMAAMFYLFSILCYIKGRILQRSYGQKYIQGKSHRRIFTQCLWFSGCFLFGMLSIGSKQNTATLPIFILLYEWFFFQHLKLVWTKKKIIFIGVVFLVLTTVIMMFMKINPQSHPLFTSKEFSLSERLLTQSRVVVYYVSLIVFPFPSRWNLDYDYSPSFSFFQPPTAVITLLLIIGLILFSVMRVKNERILIFAILWYLGNLVIESSILPLAFIYEHRTYIPSMLTGFFYVILTQRFAKLRWVNTLSYIMIIILFSTWTYQRNETWSEDIALWQDCVKKAPNNARPYCNLGEALGKKNEFIKAQYYLKQAIKIEPKFSMALYNLGYVYARQNRLSDAVSYYRKALQINPNYIEANYNLGLILVTIKKLNAAARHFNKVLSLDPDHLQAHMNLGNVYSESGRLSEALNHYLTVLKRNPNNSLAYNNIGNTYAKMGRYEQGIKFYLKALKIDPGYENARKNLNALRNLVKHQPIKHNLRNDQ